MTKGKKNRTQHWTAIDSLIPQRCCAVLSHFCCVWLLVTIWTVAQRAPLSVGFSRRECQSGLPRPPPGGLPDPEIKPASLLSPALADRSFTAITTWEAPSRTDHLGCVGLATLLHLHILCMHAELLQLRPWGHKEAKPSDFHNSYMYINSFMFIPLY